LKGGIRADLPLPEEDFGILEFIAVLEYPNLRRSSMIIIFTGLELERNILYSGSMSSISVSIVHENFDMFNLTGKKMLNIISWHLEVDHLLLIATDQNWIVDLMPE
jgi:hypothetical protein